MTYSRLQEKKEGYFYFLIILFSLVTHNFQKIFACFLLGCIHGTCAAA